MRPAPGAPAGLAARRRKSGRAWMGNARVRSIRTGLPVGSRRLRGLSESARSRPDRAGPIDARGGAAAAENTPDLGARDRSLGSPPCSLASAVRQLPRNPLEPLLRPAGTAGDCEALQVRFPARLRIGGACRAGLLRLRRAVPEDSRDLLESGVLTAEARPDPSRAPIPPHSPARGGKFRIYGRDAQGDIDLDLSFERSLAPVAESKPVRPQGPKSEPECASFSRL